MRLHLTGAVGLTGWGALRPLVAGIVGMSLVLSLGDTAVMSAADRPACKVRNRDSGQTYRDLQSAVDAAKRDEHLVVRGTCRGKTVVGKSLVIEGVRTKQWGRPTLDGGGQYRVLLIKHGKVGRPSSWPVVSVRRLTVQNGHARTGGGIYNRSTLRLRGVVVRRNRADLGAGGILNWNALHLNGKTRVVDNRAGAWGGGIYNEVGRVVMNDDSRVSRNTAKWGGGVVNQEGTLILNDSARIDGNRARRGTADDGAGGIHSMHGSETGVSCGSGGNVYGNTPGNCSGG